jgi:hypothetical protein
LHPELAKRRKLKFKISQSARFEKANSVPHLLIANTQKPKKLVYDTSLRAQRGAAASYHRTAHTPSTD